jgi:hypothetical protein
MRKFQVRLVIPTCMWAIVEVEADNEEAAIDKALESNSKGEVSYEDSGYDQSEAEVQDVDEVV